MKVFMTGATGFVGTYLSLHLIASGHEVTIVTPTVPDPHPTLSGLSYIQGNTNRMGRWQDRVQDHNVIVNLAGASIFSRWTKSHKKVLRASRIDTTRHLVDAMPANARAVTFFSTSAVGYYGFHEDEELTETSPAGNDFLARLAVDWEAQALEATAKGARVILTRLGIVLGQNGGALAQMLPMFRFFLGGPLGAGKQWFSWVHMRDLARTYSFLMDQPALSGVFNICSPYPVRNRQLAQAIGKAMKRPAFMPAPGFMIKLILGEFGSVLLKGQRVIPRRLLDAGFRFDFPTIDTALADLI